MTNNLEGKKGRGRDGGGREKGKGGRKEGRKHNSN